MAFEKMNRELIENAISGRSQNVINDDSKTVKTGYDELDYCLGGLRRGETYLLGARPGMGKTAFALNLVEAIAVNQGKRVIYFSLDEGKGQLAERLVKILSRIKCYLAVYKKNGKHAEKVDSGIEKIDKTEFYIEDMPDLSVEEMDENLENLDKPIDLIIVDYLQLFSREEDDHKEQMGDVCDDLKQMAIKYRCPVLILSRLSRTPENRKDHRPIIYDFKEHRIQRHVDNIIFLYRDAYYDHNTELKNRAEFNIVQCKNGRRKAVELAWLADYQKFCNVEHERKNQEEDSEGFEMRIPHIDHAFENIESACKDRLSKLYPVNVPEAVSFRYIKELAYLKSSEYIDDFEIFRRLSEESVRCSAIITMRGTVTGSFIYYLLGNNCFNPLSAHYYCSVCGHYEQVQTNLFGIDLPKKACPNCGKEIFADGFNIPLESVWGNDGKKIVVFDYNVSTEFLPFARRVLVSLYPDNSIVPWGMFQSDATTSFDNDAVGVGLAGYAVIPSENTIQDYPDLLSCLVNGDLCVTGEGWELEESFLKPIQLFPLDYMDSLIQLQRATGIYANELSNVELREMTWSNIFNTTVLDSTTGNLFHELKPKTFREMISIVSSSYNTFSWEKDGCKDLYDYTNMTSSDAFTRFPCFTREDFFDLLLEEGFEKSFAFDVSEQIRKGYANPSTIFSEKFNSLPIPSEIKEVARNYLYLVSRAHCVEYMLVYTRLAYYAKIDSRAFSKIVFSKKK